MSRILSTVLMVLWGLWFGGAMALFIFVVALFRHDRPLAIAGAPILFLAFERYHLILGVLTLAACGGWIAAGQSRAKTMLLLALMAASTAAVVSSTIVTPKIIELRQQNRIQTPEFERAHKMSTRIYTSEAVLLLIAGIFLASAMAHESGNRQADAPQARNT
jgi:hypothetical protein